MKVKLPYAKGHATKETLLYEKEHEAKATLPYEKEPRRRDSTKAERQLSKERATRASQHANGVVIHVHSCAYGRFRGLRRLGFHDWTSRARGERESGIRLGERVNEIHLL